MEMLLRVRIKNGLDKNCMIEQTRGMVNIVSIVFLTD